MELLGSFIKQNPTVLDNRSALVAILSDLYPTERKRINSLMMVYDSGVIDELRYETELDDLSLSRYVKMVIENYDLTSSAAKDLVLQWSEVFDLEISISFEEPRISISVQDNANKPFIPLFHSWLSGQDELEEMFFELLSRIESNPSDYKARNKLIDLLECASCFEAYETLFDVSQWADEIDNVKQNKKKAFELLREIVTYYYRENTTGSYTQRQRMSAMSLIVDAQCSMFTGDFVRALQSYSSFLTHPLVTQSIRKMDEDQWCCGEFSFRDDETILNVLYNMNQIFKIIGLPEKGKKLYTRYKNIVRYQYESVHRIEQNPKNSADTARRIKEAADVRCGFKESNKLFILKGITFSKDRGSILDIGFEHPEEPNKVDIDNEDIFYEYDGFEVVFRDDIYEFGFASFYPHEVDLDMQREKIKILF